MRKCLLILFICSHCEVSFSQNSKIDSLTALLKTPNSDTAKVNTLNELAYEYSKNNADTAIYFGNQALELATKINYIIGMADAHLWIGSANLDFEEYNEVMKNCNVALKLYDQELFSNKIPDKYSILKQKARVYNNIGVVSKRQGNYFDALQNDFIALKLRKEIGYKKGIASSYGNIGGTFDYLGNYPEALKNYFAALKIFEEIGDKQRIANTYNGIGNVYLMQNNYSEALKNFFEAQKIHEEIGDKKGISDCYINFGNVYEKKGNYSTALNNYLTSLKIKNEIKDVIGIAGSYNNIGGIFKHLKNYSDALLNFTASLKIFEELGNKDGIAICYINISDIYIMQKRFKDAQNYLNKNLTLSKDMGSKDNIKEVYRGFAALDSAIGNFRQAYEHYKIYITYRDSLLNEENTEKTVQSQMQYEFDKKETATKAAQEKKDALVKAEIQRQKTIKNSIVGGSGILAISALFSFVFYRRRREAVMQNKITDSRLRAINAQMDDHFIFNCMQSIQSFIQKRDLQNADTYLVKFSKLIRKVLDNSTQKEITLADDLETLENYVELEKLRLDYPLTYKATIADDVNAQEIFIPPLLIQPFVENAIKHGLQGKNEPGVINLEIKKSENHLEIFISDNGTGRKEKPDNTNKRKSYGIPLSQERLNYLGVKNKIKAIFDVADVYDAEGKINGTKVFLKIPHA